MWLIRFRWIEGVESEVFTDFNALKERKAELLTKPYVEHIQVFKIQEIEI